MKAYGNINMGGNVVQHAIVILDDSANFPAVPEIGQLIFKSGRMYMCLSIESGVPAWVPLGGHLTYHTHTQSVPATTWTITHNLKTLSPTVSVYDQNGEMIVPDQIVVDSLDAVRVVFGVATSGRSSVVIGSLDGVTRREYAYEHLQTTPSAVWTVNHSLGYNPIVRVFIGGSEVQPLSIQHTSTTTAIITFSTPQVGFARCY